MAKELATMGDKRMTVREIADALGYEQDTIRKKVKELYPDLISQGKVTLLTEPQVLMVKKSLTPRTLALKSGVDNTTTELERQETIAKAIQYLIEDRETLKAQLAEAAPKVESFDALMVSDSCMSITDAAKHFGLHAKLTVFPYFREKCYLTKFNLPTQKAIDADFLTLRQCRGNDGEMHSQSVVRRCQLENWRTKVVPQVKEWAGI